MSLHTFAAPSALSLQYVPLAQLVEYQTFNLGVAGSSPAWRTTKRILAKRDTSPVFFYPLHTYISFPLSVGRARLRPIYMRLMADCRFDSGEPQSSFFIFLLSLSPSGG